MTGTFAQSTQWRDKARTAARHKDVDHAAQAHEHVGRGAIGRLDDADASARACRPKPPHRAAHARWRRRTLAAKRTAAQHAGVARLQADARSIGGDVGTCLVNDGHHARAGPLTRESRMPLSSVRESNTRLSGSGSATRSSSASAMAMTRPSSSIRRSSRLSLVPA